MTATEGVVVTIPGSSVVLAAQLKSERVWADPMRLSAGLAVWTGTGHVLGSGMIPP